MTRSLAVAALAFLLACADSATDPGGRATAPLEPTTRDSAGVTIHEHAADALERAPLIVMDSVPVAVIGDDTESGDVTRMFALVLLSNGHAVGFDAQRGAVRYFDASGTEVASHGRTGQGPGEFGQFSVNVAAVTGDTVVVSDVSNGRVSLVTARGGVVSVQSANFRQAGEIHNVAGRFAEGSYVLAPGNMLAARSAAEVQPPRRAPLAIGRLRDSASVHQFDTLVVVPGTEMMRYRSKFGPTEDLVDGVPAFGARTYVTAWDGMAAIMTNERWDVRRYGHDGRLVSVVAVNAPLQAVNDSVVQVWREATLQLTRERAAQDTARAADIMASTEFYLEHVARAEFVPPFMGVQGTGGKLLWLMEYPISATDSIRYTAVHTDGRLMGRLVLPPMTRVVGFGDDRLAIRAEDEDGIARLSIHRLTVPE